VQTKPPMFFVSIFVKALYTGELWIQEVNTAKNEALHMNGTPPFIKYGEGIIKFGNFWEHNGLYLVLVAKCGTCQKKMQSL